MITDIAERFSTQCAVVVENSYDTCGTITRASVSTLTPSQLEEMFVRGGLFADLDAFFHTAIEMRACGTEVNGMYDWIMSGADRIRFRDAISGTRIVGSGSFVQPFVMAKQDSILNKEYWVVTGGAANSAYTGDTPDTIIGTATAGPLTTADKALGAAGDRVIRLVSRYGVELDAKWFNPRTVIYLMSVSSGVTQNGAWRVLASAVSTAGDYIDALVTSENSGSNQEFAAAPTTGIVTIGVNNVNDYESWCHNLPNPNVHKRVPFWFQTIRRSRCVDQFYKEFLKRMMESGVNRAFAEFGDVSMVERNRQDEEEFQRRFVNAFFFQKPYNGNQDLTNYQLLPQITTPSGFAIDPGTGGKLIQYRANFIGVLEQLYRCGMVIDAQGNPLNFYDWLTINYQLMRSRSTRKGKPVTEIDWYTSTSYAAKLNTAFMQYWKAESQEMLAFSMDVPQGENAVFGFTWKKYRVNWPSGLTINIVSHFYFDDLFSAHSNENQGTAGNLLLALDIGKPGPLGRGGSIYWAQMASHSVMHTRGSLEDLARIDADWSCVMRSTTVEQRLQSDTGTVVVECPQDNRWVWGLADLVPIITGPTYPYSDLI